MLGTYENTCNGAYVKLRFAEHFLGGMSDLRLSMSKGNFLL